MQILTTLTLVLAIYFSIVVVIEAFHLIINTEQDHPMQIGKRFFVAILWGLFFYQYMYSPINGSHYDVDTDGVTREYSAPDYNNRKTAARDYQIEVDNDSIYMYDANRLVKTMSFTDDSEIGQAIIGDNQ